jgi:hypothetical protein
VAKSKQSQSKKSKRPMVVFTSLVGCLTLTGGLLVALAPSPLSPDGPASLSAVAGSDAMSSIYATTTPVALGHWTAIYVHHSGARPVVAASSGDHFVIGAGGDVHYTSRWAEQAAPAAPAGAASIDPGCVSICLVGNFDEQTPSSAQVTRLNQLVQSLQTKLGLPGRSVITVQQPGSPVSVGRNFPAAEFRNQLLR